MESIFSEVGGRTLYRVLVGDAGGENETALLNETVPSWVTSNVEENCPNKFIKVQFYLLPHSSMLKQDRMKKVKPTRRRRRRRHKNDIYVCFSRID